MSEHLSTWERARKRLGLLLAQPVATEPVRPEGIAAPEQMALYVHIPFCGSTCSYCSFNKVRRPAELLGPFVDALVREIRTYAAEPELASVRLSSLYFGGGTPSHLPADDMARLLEEIRSGFELPPSLQITLEANPESLPEDKLRQYRASGINRISLGVQSLDERFLRILGRRHRAGDVREVVERIRAAGIDELNADLMYGLPGQSLDDFAADLRQLMALPITHVALFPLSHRPGTALEGRRAGRPPLRRMYQHALEALEHAGFQQYTTEDFTRAVPCQYQVDLWQPPPSDCLGLGPGALSGLGDRNWHNVGDLDAYVAAANAGQRPIAASGRVTERQRMIDHTLVAARTLGLDLEDFEARFGLSFRAALGPWDLLVRGLGLARATRPGMLELSPGGRYVASRLWSEYILHKLAQASASSAIAPCGPGQPATHARG